MQIKPAQLDLAGPNDPHYASKLGALRKLLKM